jgi:DNA-binding IclR family transcriptional regulator
MPIQSIERVNQILSLFSLERPRWGITEMANALGLRKTTVSSLVRTLAKIGFLDQDLETRRYTMGPKIFALGVIAGETYPLNQKAEKPARDLAEKTGLICRVAVWDEDATLQTMDIIPKDVDFLARRVGPRVAAYGSSLGRAILAHLDPEELREYLDKTRMIPFTPYTITRRDALVKELNETRKRGYAVNNQGIILSRASIAAPLFGRHGRVIASISLVGSPEKILGAELDTFVRNLQNTAMEISRFMGFDPTGTALAAAPAGATKTRRMGRQSAEKKLKGGCLRDGLRKRGKNGTS